MSAAALQPSRHVSCLVDGRWVDEGTEYPIHNPFDQSVIGTVTAADAGSVERAVRSARSALQDDFPLYERVAVLERAAAMLDDQRERVMRELAQEAGKPLSQAAVEAERAAETLRFTAAAARDLKGSVVPMDATRFGAGKTAYTLRVPLGVVAAITPFNFPLNLVAHKVAPAIAAGNSVVLKPALATPLSATSLTEFLLEAGLPAGRIQLLHGPGDELGPALIDHPDVAAVSFTGSPEVGWGIRARASRKHVTLELGSSSPLIVDRDSDWEQAAAKAAVHGFTFAGQSCISLQRVIVHRALADRFLVALLEGVSQLRVGDQLRPDTDVGPLITPAATARVLEWVREAAESGAGVATGGGTTSDGLVQPTVLDEPSLDSRVWADEVFGPVVCVTRFDDFEEAVALANASRYGLQAGVFTRSIARALHAASALQFGGVLINEVPTFRADHQPYGGVKDSGIGHEGPRWAISELSQERLVSLQATR